MSRIDVNINHERFSKWAVIFARAASKHQDLTFRQLVERKIIPSWAEFVLKEARG